jgi:L-asparaginase II
MSAPQVLVEFTRAGLLETVNRGWIAVARGDGSLVGAVGDPEHVIYPRSAMKPFQAIAMVESGAADRFDFGDQELAVSCASHNGEARHKQVVAGMLERAGQPISAMLNGADPEWATGFTIPKEVNDDNQLAQNCSGKHAGMVVACAAKGLPVAAYADFEHPYQVEIKRIVSDFWEVAPDDLVAGRDNCTLPAYAAPIRNVATGWAKIASPEHAPAAHRAAISRLGDAMGRDPFMVAGTNRFNTFLMETTGGRILAKDGAEGVLCMAVRDLGLGIAFKLEDGSFHSHGIIARRLLRQLGAISDEEDARLADVYGTELRSNRDQHVGDMQAVFELERV